MTDDEMPILLSRDEALVLFDWLANLEKNGEFPGHDSAEQKVLWRIESQLEKLLVEPLKPDYTQLVETAKRRILRTS